MGRGRGLGIHVKWLCLSMVPSRPPERGHFGGYSTFMSTITEKYLNVVGPCFVYIDTRGTLFFSVLRMVEPAAL